MPERRLQTSQDLRRYLANLINRVETGKIEPGIAKGLGYLSSILLRVIEGSDFEKRLEAVEKRLERKEEPHEQSEAPTYQN